MSTYNYKYSKSTRPGRATNLDEFLGRTSGSSHALRTTSTTDIIPHDDTSRYKHSSTVVRKDHPYREYQPSPTTISSEHDINRHDTHDERQTTRRVQLPADMSESPNVTIDNDRTKSRRPNDLSQVQQLLTLVKEIQNVDIESVESSLQDRSTPQTKVEQQKLSEEYQSLKEAYDESLKKHEEIVSKYTELKSTAKQIIKDTKEKAQQENEESMKVFKMRLKEREDEIRSLKSEKDSALSRLSKEMGDKLSENNAGIADLSDPNRSTKIAEKYNSLYDNEWTDALESITQNNIDEEAGVRFLLEIKKHIYSFCTKTKTELIQDLEERLENPSSAPRGENVPANYPSAKDKQILQLLETCVKLKIDTTIANLQKDYIKLSHKPRYAERLPEYVNKCIEICWLMNTHSPPLVFAEPLEYGQIYDKDQYKEFTKQGDAVSFVVWLPLLIEKDGAILSKGVVQPILRKTKVSPKSEPKLAWTSEKVRSSRETHDEQMKRLMQNERRSQYDRQVGESTNRNEQNFADLLEERKDTEIDERRYDSKGNYRYSTSSSDQRVNDFFQESRYRPISQAVTSQKTPSVSTHNTAVSSQPRTNKYYENNKGTNEVSNSTLHTESFNIRRPGTGSIHGGFEQSLSYFDPSKAEMFSSGGKTYALYNNQLYARDSDRNWRAASGIH